MQKTRVLLVDDHALFRKGIASLLNNLPEIEIVGEAGSGEEGIRKASELKPDIVILDVEMPGLSGVETVDFIKKELPDCKVVMLTISDEDNNLFNSIKNGAQGYLLKSMDPDVLIEEIKSLIKGEAALSKSMASKILNEFARISQREVKIDYANHNLTEREAEVLKLVAQGITNKVIANKLAITENTVKNHLCNIMEKLHLQNRVQLATYAWREGLMEK